jgi:hypothetical protein
MTRPHPTAVVRALCSLETGKHQGNAMRSWLANLSRDREQLVMAVWVIVVVCEADPCDACLSLGQRDCMRCMARLKDNPVHDENLLAMVALVYDALGVPPGGRR